MNTTRGVRQGCRLAPALWSAVSGDILTQIVQNAFTGPITIFADDHIGAWTFHTVDDIIAMEQEVLRLFRVLSEAGLSVSPSKSKLVVQAQGAATERYLADRTVHHHGQPHWCFGEGENMVAVPIVKEFVYLGTIVTLSRHSDRTVAHRLEEARKREGQLRKSIRSRSVLRSSTRVAIWRACVVASALYGLLAQELTAANITTLRQWYHRSLRAVTGMLAHITHVTNADLRTKYGLMEPLAALLKLTQNKQRRLALLPAGHAATLPATMDHWRRCEQQLSVLAHTDNRTITPLLVEVPGVPCPYCGVYFQHTKAMRQHTARNHGINWKEPLQIDYDPSIHATKGMPECRHCGKKRGSHQGLKHHIMHNTCGWYHTQHCSTQRDRQLLTSQTQVRGTPHQYLPQHYPPGQGGQPRLTIWDHRNHLAMRLYRSRVGNRSGARLISVILNRLNGQTCPRLRRNLIRESLCLSSFGTDCRDRGSGQSRLGPACRWSSHTRRDFAGTAVRE